MFSMCRKNHQVNESVNESFLVGFGFTARLALLAWALLTCDKAFLFSHIAEKPSRDTGG